MKYLFGKIYSGDQVFYDKVIEISEGKIAGVSDDKKYDYDFSDSIATPGFIDIHTHGVKGIDSYSMNSEQLSQWLEIQLLHGTHYILPTIVSAPLSNIRDFLRVIREGKKTYNDRIMGARFEGPLISPLKKGAHDINFLKTPSEFPLDELINEFPDLIKIIDIAPELPGALDMISKYPKIIFSLGHTNCKYEECKLGYEAGAHHVTHLFNAMREFHHRDTGLVGFALTNNNIRVEIIPDLIHIAPEVIKIVFKCKRKEEIIIITDSIQATLMPDGQYKLGSLDVEVKEGICKIKGTDTIAGSTLTLDKAFKNMISLGFKIEEFLNALTKNPAELMGLKAGLISEGYDASINVWNKSYNLEAVIRDKIIEVRGNGH